MPTEDELLRRRDWNFRRLRGRRVRDARGVLAFVREVGFCSTFYRFPEPVPCLWEAVVGRAAPRWPRHSHHDAGVGTTWQLKDELPARRRVYYGKALRGRPTLVALDCFAALYALVRGRQRARDWRQTYTAGRMTATARRIMEAITREHPQYTRELRASAFLLDASRTREFERAMAELQQGLWIVKTAERYEPSFSYRWDLVEAWLPDAVAQGRRLSRAAALDRLVTRHARAAVLTSERTISRLLGVSTGEVSMSVARLTRARVLARWVPPLKSSKSLDRVAARA